MQKARGRIASSRQTPSGGRSLHEEPGWQNLLTLTAVIPARFFFRENEMKTTDYTTMKVTFEVREMIGKLRAKLSLLNNGEQVSLSKTIGDAVSTLDKQVSKKLGRKQ